MCYFLARGCWDQGEMEYRFKADEWGRLTTAERARRCKLLSDEARHLAEAAPPETREIYLRLATEWLHLATHIQREDSATDPA